MYSSFMQACIGLLTELLVLETRCTKSISSTLCDNPIRLFENPHRLPTSPEASSDPASLNCITKYIINSITAPDSTSSVPAPVANLEAAPLSDVIGAIYAGQKAYSESKLPPLPPTTRPTKWIPTQEPDAPHAPYAYWPMRLYK